MANTDITLQECAYEIICSLVNDENVKDLVKRLCTDLSTDVDFRAGKAIEICVKFVHYRAHSEWLTDTMVQMVPLGSSQETCSLVSKLLLSLAQEQKENLSYLIYKIVRVDLIRHLI